MSVFRELRVLLARSGFRKLFLVRLISQAGDGMFQVGLASLLFFSPESHGSAPAIAGAFAIMLAPFTVVGPFAGVFLDRWSRRQVLVIGNALRVVITGAMAASMLLDGVSVWIYVLGLAALSVNRFLLAGLSAGLPLVVDHKKLLLTANALTPTLGAGAAFLGGLGALVVTQVAPTGRIQDATALTCAAAVMGMASLAGLRLRRDELGPVTPASGRMTNEFVVVARGLADGARYLAVRRTPGQALLAMAAHRFCYGVVFIASILMARNLLATPGDTASGLAVFAQVVAATGIGGGVSIIMTAWLGRQMRPQSWIATMLLAGAASQLLLVPNAPGLTVLLVAAGLLGMAAQGAKIAVDTIVQRDSEDEYRGRAFAFFDVLYNAAFVGAAALAAVVVPDTGWSPTLFVALAVVYLLVGLLVGLKGAREPHRADQRLRSA